ncbi:DEAD/DEAH box helicase [Aureococcus anophagefferens]|uniref:DEAD/DEAH box helicase n=1 Tax=Aureococcus anophagefferens TaxID=44056 RepID=A0ABR1G5M0_AURAN
MIHATLLPGAGGERSGRGRRGTRGARPRRPRAARRRGGGAARRGDDDRAYDSGGDETEAYDSDGAKALTGEEKLRRRAAGAERRARRRARRRAPAPRSRRRSSIAECAKLFAALVEGGTRTLAFGRTRKLVELVLGYAKERLEAGRAPSSRAAQRRPLAREAPAAAGAASHAADHARAVSLRVVDPVTFSVKCGGAVVDEVPYSRAFYELYEGAVYLIQARPTSSRALDVMTHEATVVAEPHGRRPEKVLRSNREVRRIGVVHVSSKVWGYRKVCKKTLRILSMHEFSLPNLEFTTRDVDRRCGARPRDFASSTRLQCERRALDAIAARRLDARAGLHALNHALLALAPLFVLCDPGDVATEHVYPFQTRAAAAPRDRRCTGHNVALDRDAARLIVDALLDRGDLDEGAPAAGAGAAGAARATRRAKAAATRAARLDRAGVLPGARALGVRPEWAPCLPDFRPGASRGGRPASARFDRSFTALQRRQAPGRSGGGWGTGWRTPGSFAW